MLCVIDAHFREYSGSLKYKREVTVEFDIFSDILSSM